MEFHEYCDMFPCLEKEDYYKLVADIKKNGLLEPIVLFEGKILDGKNRYKACLEANVKPTFVDFKGNDPLAYVISLNLVRRHLTAGQRAFLALDHFMPQEEEAAKKRKGRPLPSAPKGAHERASKRAGAKVDVSGRSIERAKSVRARGHADLEKRVVRGDLSITTAYQRSNARVEIEAKKQERKSRPPKQTKPELTPEIGAVIEIVKSWKNTIKELRESTRVKASPEAKNFLITKFIRPIIKALQEWEKELG